jgi:hypothetical protein
MHNNTVQRNEEWIASRLGIPTASRYKEILTEPKTKADKEAGVMSQTAKSYALDLLAERLTGVQKEFSTQATEWGTNNEPLAIAQYQEITNTTVLECGFVKHETLDTGASPDGLIGIDGGVEVKCPYNTSIHLNNVITKEIPPEYFAQIQGQIWVCGLEWIDFVSFDPRIESQSKISIVKVYRNEEFINKLESKVINFLDELQNLESLLRGEK